MEKNALQRRVHEVTKVEKIDVILSCIDLTSHLVLRLPPSNLPFRCIFRFEVLMMFLEELIASSMHRVYGFAYGMSTVIPYLVTKPHLNQTSI